jgi:hypothetical protein
VSYEEETLHRNYPLTLHEEEDTCVSYEEEDTCESHLNFHASI